MMFPSKIMMEATMETRKMIQIEIAWLISKQGWTLLSNCDHLILC
jgi:hypothetical protein